MQLILMGTMQSIVTDYFWFHAKNVWSSKSIIWYEKSLLIDTILTYPLSKESAKENSPETSPSRKESAKENTSKPSPSRKDSAKENTSKPSLKNVVLWARLPELVKQIVTPTKQIRMQKRCM